MRHFLDRLPLIGRDVQALNQCISPPSVPARPKNCRAFISGPTWCRRIPGRVARPIAWSGWRAGSRLLLVRASRGREMLAEELTKAGGIVEQVVVYEQHRCLAPDAEFVAKMAAGEIHWTTVTSSAIARSLVRLLRRFASRDKARQHQPHYVGYAPRIGPRTGSGSHRVHDAGPGRCNPIGGLPAGKCAAKKECLVAPTPPVAVAATICDDTLARSCQAKKFHRTQRKAHK